VDDFGAKLQALSAELSALLSEQKGEIDLEFINEDEVTVKGDRAGFARLALEAMNAAQPPEGASAAEIPFSDDGLLISPLSDLVRTDFQPVQETPMRWKDRFLSAGCVILGLFALAMFLRGCAAFESDVHRWLQ
jgi:hypothetical protein